MPWHTFEKYQKYGLDVVSAKIQKRINEGVSKTQRQRSYGSKTLSVVDTKCWSGNPNLEAFFDRLWTGGRGEQFTDHLVRVWLV